MERTSFLLSPPLSPFVFSFLLSFFQSLLNKKINKTMSMSVYLQPLVSSCLFVACTVIFIFYKIGCTPLIDIGAEARMSVRSLASAKRWLLLLLIVCDLWSLHYSI